MTSVRFPDGFRLEPLRRDHPRPGFQCGEPAVDDWLKTRALQQQNKHLSVTKVLLRADARIAGIYTIATGQVDFGDLPPRLTKRLPHRALPVAVLAWLGVDHRDRRRGLGRLLLASALRDCYDAGRTFAFLAVILDCMSDSAKEFYQQWDFRELPGYRNRLFLSWNQLAGMMDSA